ncbi:MAG: hypothetical protein DDT26_00027 [Dehalococcoidia bacterium]|nr:hypothetical protein [Chloroflexota bacterium]
MPIVVEDGNGLVDSNSYVSSAFARAFAAERGITLPVVPSSGVDPVDALLVKAKDYMEALEPRFKGERTDANVATHLQALSWPRKGVTVGCSARLVRENEIPARIKEAQCHLVVAQNAGFDLQPAIDPNRGVVKREKVDVLETEFFSPKEVGAGYGAAPTFPAVDAALAGFVRSGHSAVLAFRG